MTTVQTNRILFVPFGIDPRYRLRSDELAKSFAALTGQEVYYLQAEVWQNTNFAKKLLFLFRNIFRPITVKKDEFGVHRVTVPYLFIPQSRWTMPLIRNFASYQLKRTVQNITPTQVVNASYRDFHTSRGNFTHIYDLVDDLLAEDQDNWYGRDVVRFVTQELTSAQEIWTISHSLKDKLLAAGYSSVRYVPNGANTQLYEDPKTKKSGEKLRDSFAFKDKVIISFIGNHGVWTGLDLLTEIVKASPPEWHYLIVGGGDALKDHEADLKKLPNVTNIGPVPPSEVAAYFTASDIGILTFRKEPFTDNALPLKIIEYGAAEKLVVSESLTELLRLAFPHVIFPKERTPEAWIAAIALAHKKSWERGWTQEIRKFDWQKIAADVATAGEEQK